MDANVLDNLSNRERYKLLMDLGRNPRRNGEFMLNIAEHYRTQAESKANCKICRDEGIVHYHRINDLGIYWYYCACTCVAGKKLNKWVENRTCSTCGKYLVEIETGYRRCPNYTCEKHKGKMPSHGHEKMDTFAEKGISEEEVFSSSNKIRFKKPQEGAKEFIRTP